MLWVDGFGVAVTENALSGLDIRPSRQRFGFREFRATPPVRRHSGPYRRSPHGCCQRAMLVGYMRVSTDGDRHVMDQQRDALLAPGVDERHLFEGRASGSRHEDDGHDLERG